MLWLSAHRLSINTGAPGQCVHNVYRPWRREIMCLVASVPLSVRPFNLVIMEVCYIMNPWKKCPWCGSNPTGRRTPMDFLITPLCIFYWAAYSLLQNSSSWKKIHPSHLLVIGIVFIPCAHTLSRKSLTCFVITKPRGSIVITKPLALRMSLRARKAISTEC